MIKDAKLTQDLGNRLKVTMYSFESDPWLSPLLYNPTQFLKYVLYTHFFNNFR